MDPTQICLIAQDGIGGYDWSYQAEEEQLTNYALMAFTSSRSSSSSDSEVDSCFIHGVKAYATLKEQYDNLSSDYKNQVIDKFKTGLGYDAATTASPAVESFVNLTDKSGSDKGYHSVPPPLTRNFIPRKPDLTFVDEIIESENLDVTTVVTLSNAKTVENKGVSNTVESNAVRMNNTSALIIEDWNSNDEINTVRPVNTANTKAVNLLYDNGIEFKSSIMNQFCEMKGIKREFSIAKTPQQNGVAKRKNRTLIEAARTMLVDSKLPVTFWAKAVNTACYVLNRGLSH
ncbi:ribonuclease H-like domain-containing protein [Tanacetum coccineum]